MSQPNNPPLDQGKYWDSFAPMMATYTQANLKTDALKTKERISPNPMHVPNLALVSELNKVRPFATATTILEIGCGSGTGVDSLIKNFGDQLPVDAKVVATDFSSAMIDLVKSLQSQKLDTSSSDFDKRWECVTAVVADAQDLQSFSDNSASHVLASFVLFMVPNPELALREILRVLAPGGVLALSTWRTTEWGDAIIHAFTKVKPNAEFNLLTKEWSSVDGITDILSKAGFNSVTTEDIKTHMGIGTNTGGLDIDRAVLMLSEMPPVKEAIRNYQLNVENIREEVKRHIKNTLGDAESGHLTGWSILAFGKK